MSIVHNNRRLALAVSAVMGSISTIGLAASPTIDGTRDTDYKSSLSTQTIDTGFGDNFSELDAVYARVAGGKLHLFIAGNIENNFNKVDLFFDTRSGGQNVIRNDNADVDFNKLNNNIAGLTFDSGFEADHYLMYGRNSTDVFLNHGVLLTGGGGAGGSLGSVATPNAFEQGAGTISGHGFNLEFGYSNANTGGIGGTTGAAADTAAAELVSTGAEIVIDLAEFNITNDLAVSAMINNDNHNYLSNQVLGGLPVGTGNIGGDGAGGFTGTLAGINFNNFAGNQFFNINLGNASNVWNVDAPGDWGTNGNWDLGSPDASGDFAYFGPAISSAQTINLDGNKTVGGIIFNNSNKYTISGTNTLTIDTPSSTALVIVNGGSHDITAPVSLAKSTLFNITGSTNKLKITNLSAGSASVTKTGDGTLEVNQVQTSGALTVNGGVLEVTLGGGSTGVVSSSGLSISGGKIELHDNDLVNNYGAGPSNYTDVVNAVKSGLVLLGGTGTTGIGSAEVDAQTVAGTMLGVVDNGDPLIAGAITALSGFTIPSPTSSVLVKYTWFGDSNLDGVVDGSDYALIDTGFTAGGALGGWVFGDYDYSGTIDGSDYALIDTGFISQTGTLPEPASIGLLGLGAIGLLRRRKA